jgi:hypothetical protein
MLLSVPIGVTPRNRYGISFLAFIAYSSPIFLTFCVLVKMANDIESNGGRFYWRYNTGLALRAAHQPTR